MVLCKQYDPFAGCENTAPLSDKESIEKCDSILICPKITKNSHCPRRPKKYRCNRRIKRLAVPRSFTSKYCIRDPPKTSVVEVVRPFEEQTPVRIKLLAYPKVRKLISSRDQYREFIDASWYKRFDVLIKKSMHTLYSRLANVQYPESTPTKRWEKKDWERHCEWLKKRACPKIQKEAPRIKRNRVPLNDLMASFYSLSQPRHPRSKYIKTYGIPSTVSDNVKNYIPTERIANLARPKHPKDDSEEINDPFQVDYNARHFQTTDRLKDLSQPKTAQKEQLNDNITVFGVLKRALKAKTNPRTLELSKPKPSGGDDDDDEEKPTVNPKARHAKASPRIIELAKPRIITDKFKM